MTLHPRWRPGYGRVASCRGCRPCPTNPQAAPRMAATYASGTVHARRWHGDGDVRGYLPPRGWTAHADLTDLHPLTGRAVWWIIETKE